LRDKTLAGKKALFDVTILEASKRTMPELTDEFAAKVRSGLTVASLEDELKKAVDSEGEKEYMPSRNAALTNALAEVMDVDVPDTLVTGKAREKFALMMTDMRNNGVSDEEIKNQIVPENFLKYQNIVRADIVKDFKASMATDEIARMENIEVPDFQVEEQMEAIRKDAAQSQEEIDEAMVRGKVEATLQRQAVMDFLAENGNLKVEYTDGEQFDEALLEEVAQESLRREEEFVSTEEAGEFTIVDGEVEEAAPVSAEAGPEPVAEVKEAHPAPEPDESAPAKDRDYTSMTLEDKAYYALKDAGLLDN
jgi:trigger factor